MLWLIVRWVSHSRCLTVFVTCVSRTSFDCFTVLRMGRLPSRVSCQVSQEEQATEENGYTLNVQHHQSE